MTPNGKRPTGLFAPGVMVGKTLYIAGKGDYRPNARVPREGRELPERDPQDVADGRPRHEACRQVVRLSRRPRPVRRAQQALRQVLPGVTRRRGRRSAFPRCPGDSRVEITCIAYGDLAETKRIGEPPRGPPVQSRHPGGRYALRLGQGRPASRRQLIPRRSTSRSGRRCRTSRRRSSRPGSTSGTSS